MTATVCIASCSSSIPIRGHLVHLDAAWRALIEHREYPARGSRHLGRSGGGFAAAGRHHQIRGCPVAAIAGRGTGVSAARAMHQRARGARSGPLPRSRGSAAAAAAGIGDLIGPGNLTVTLETDDGAQRYQGIVPIDGRPAGRFAAGVFRKFRAVADASVAARRRQRCLRHAVAAAAGQQRRSGVGGDRRCVAARAVDRRHLDAGGAAHAGRCGNSAPAVQRGRSAAVRAVAGLFSLPMLARARRRHAAGSRRGGDAARFWPSAARSRCAAISAIAPMYSTRWTSPNCSTAAFQAISGARFTDGLIWPDLDLADLSGAGQAFGP